MTDRSDAPPTAGQRRRTTLGTLAVLVGLLAAASLTAFWGWREIGEVDISRHGLIALGLGVGVSFLVGAGLMTLVFFSSRRGYDERAHEWSRDDRQDDASNDP